MHKPVRKITTVSALGAVLMLPLGMAHAQQSSADVDALQRQLQALQAQINELKAQQQQTQQSVSAVEQNAQISEADRSAIKKIIDTVKPVEFYGVARLSLDYGDSGVNDSEENNGMGITSGDVGLSSNTTIFGLRGTHDFELGGTQYAALWQLEQSFNPGLNQGDTLANRDTFLGLKTPAGTFRAGLLDTPFKTMGILYSAFTTTVGDPHAILGTGPNPAYGRIDLRASNALMWDGKFGDVNYSLQYGLDQNRGIYDNNEQILNGTEDLIDDNSSDMYSASVSWNTGGLNLGAAYVNYSKLYSEQSIEAYRFGANYTFGAAKIGAIYENINEYDPMDRDAYGAFATYRVAPRTTAGVQWMHANETESGSDNDADQASIGVFHSLTQALSVHAMYTKTMNGDNAMYRAGDYAHGDRINTLAGNDPQAFSVGAQLKW
ncbi:porin [Halomonas sp. WWR20]